MPQKYQIGQARQLLFISLFLTVVFILAVVVWYSPVLFKGYSVHNFDTNVLLGISIYQTGFYSIESDLNVLLSSNLIDEHGHLSAYGNKLTSLIYAKIFKVMGLLSENSFILLLVVIHALTLLIFTEMILYLFNFKIASIFSLIYIFLPFNWHLSYNIGTYEFALLFLSLFFLFYFYGIKRKYSYVYLFVSGIFLALACLSKEALILIVPFLLLFLLFKKQKRYILYIFIPFFIIFAIFWLPNIIHNSYLQLFTVNVPEENKAADFATYGHVYPDPYTFHFEQKEYLDEVQNQITSNQLVLMREIDRIREFKNMGVWNISLFDRIRAGLMLGSRHVFRFASLEDIGGPLILLLILLGIYVLKKKNKYLYQFFVYWIFSTIFLLTFIILAGRNHLMDFNWAIALLASLGFLLLSELISGYLDLKGRKQFLVFIALLLIVLYNLVLAGHVSWNRTYDDSNNLLVKAYSQEIKKLNIANDEVIAVNLDKAGLYNLHYLTDKSLVIFDPKTIKDLLEENKLDFAFEQFNVKYILGYSNELSKEVIDQVDIINVASDSLKPITIEISRNKGWLMNLIN